MPRDRKRPRDDDSDSQDETVMLHTRGKDDYPESFNQGSAHAESSSESDADFNSIDVSFELFDMSQEYFKPVKNYVEQYFSHIIPDLNYSSLTSIVCDQANVGGVLCDAVLDTEKTSEPSPKDEARSVYAFTTVLSIPQYEDVLEPIRSFILKHVDDTNGTEGSIWETVLTQYNRDAKASTVEEAREAVGNNVGLLLNHRMPNLPPEIVLNSFESLVKDIEWSQTTPECDEAERKFYFHSHYLCLLRVLLPAKSQKKKCTQYTYTNFEDEILARHADAVVVVDTGLHSRFYDHADQKDHAAIEKVLVCLFSRPTLEFVIHEHKQARRYSLAPIQVFRRSSESSSTSPEDVVLEFKAIRGRRTSDDLLKDFHSPSSRSSRAFYSDVDDISASPTSSSWSHETHIEVEAQPIWSIPAAEPELQSQETHGLPSQRTLSALESLAARRMSIAPFNDASDSNSSSSDGNRFSTHSNVRRQSSAQNSPQEAHGDVDWPAKKKGLASASEANTQSMFGPNVSKVFSSQYLRYIGKNLLAPFEEEAIRERDFVIQADGLALEPSPLRLRLEVIIRSKLSESYSLIYDRIFLQKLLRSNFWEIIVDFFAIVNAACISVDLTYGNTELYHAKKYEVVVNWAETIELAYLIGFWCEVTVCLGLFGSRYFVDMFSANDLLILVVSMLPYGVCGALHGFDSYDAKAWRRFTVARLLRVLRLVKLVRFDSLFRELWILVRGITYSFRVLFWGMGIGFLIIFIFSVPSTSFFGYNPSFQGMYDGWQMDLVGVDINEYTLYRFGTVSSSMRTLFQILTLDAWAELVDPLLVCSPGVWFFFVIFIFVACFAFLNLLTAIIVQSAINFSKDEEDRNEVETSNRRRLLQSGLERYTRKTVLTKREFIEILTSTSGFDRLLKSFGCATVDDVHSILDILADPYDPECRLSIQEFLLGAQRFKTGTAKSKDLMEALSRLSVLEYIARQQSMGLRNIKMKMKKIKKVLGGNMLVLQEQIMQLTTLVEYAIGEADAADELRRFPPLMASLSTIEEDDSTESRKVWESMETLESPTTQLPELRESVEDTTRILSPNPRRPPSYSSDHSPSTHRSLPGFYLSLGDPPTYVHRASGGVYSPSSLGHPPTYIHRASGGVYSSSTSSTPPDPPFAPR